MNIDVSNLDLRSFPHHSRILAARFLRQGDWEEAFAIADSSKVVAAVATNCHLMTDTDAAKQLMWAMMRATYDHTPPRLVRECLTELQDEIRAVSSPVPHEKPWTVYRGTCGMPPDPRHGFWTFDRRVANWYARSFSHAEQHVFKTEVTDEELLFYSNASGEQEVTLLLDDDHPIEEIPTERSDFAPPPYTKEVLGAERPLAITTMMFGD